jgi:hypothetical protein
MNLLEYAPTMAHGLIMQGDVAARDRDFAYAAMCYDAAVVIYETTKGRSTPALIGPLLRLASALERLGEPRATQNLLERVRCIIRDIEAPRAQSI